MTASFEAVVRRISVLGRIHHHKLGRFAIVSLASLVTGHLLLYSAYSWLGIAPVPSNIASTVVNTALVFGANRRWVWGARDRVDLQREVVPFIALALVGLGVSTLLVWWTAVRIGEGLWINAANLVGFGLVWLARFFLLDRWVYAAG